MAKKNECKIVVILDRSGSMGVIKNETIGGFNNFIAEQKKQPGKATVTLVQFDDKYEIVYENKPLDTVEDLTDETFVPRGYTAMLDAIGKTLSTMDKKTKKAYIAIITDGQENASKEFKKPQIKELITDCEKSGWKVDFMAANMDAVSEGSAIGIPTMDCYNFAADTQGVKSMYLGMTMRSSSYRNS